MVVSLEQTATLMARDYKDPPLLVECGVMEMTEDERENSNSVGCTRESDN